MPVLESLSNQQEEESSRKFIERITGFSVIKLHRFSKIDWLICGNSLNQTTLYREPFGVAYGEFKGRKQHESFFQAERIFNLNGQVGSVAPRIALIPLAFLFYSLKQTVRTDLCSLRCSTGNRSLTRSFSVAGGTGD